MPSTTQRSTFFKWDRSSRRRNDNDEGFSEETDLGSYADDYFSDTDSDSELFSIDTYDNNYDEDDNDNDDDDDFKTECLDLWENGYIDPVTSPATEPFMGQDSQKVQLSRKITDYDDFNKAWYGLHELAVFERDLEFEKDESILNFLERMLEEVDSGTDNAVASWAEYPGSEDGIHHAGKRCGKTLIAQDVTDCQEKYEDGDATECDNHSGSDQATVQGSGFGDNSGESKDARCENASGYDDDEPVYSHGVGAIKAA